ncbi:hypothetical protein [Haloactinopolyspora sp.]|jgi:hypothetical protein|uniref:hypothetical protein n=1 Tax=Haloactinopolyspora sp. TaxID=1966353 RepID=UPI0026083D5B|nr:hypothetical protein [Haloactinopolyspora sp.]
MAEEVDNQYRLAMEDEMPRLRGHASICSFAYYEVENALENGAWTSTAADTFSNELADHHRLAGNDGEDAGAALETRFDNEPEKVPEDDDRANWP